MTTRDRVTRSMTYFVMRSMTYFALVANMTFEFSPDETVDQALCARLDRYDPLASCRDAFVLPQEVAYFDGMSLGALPKASSKHLSTVVNEQWGEGLVRSWNSARWIDAPQRLGAKIAPLLGVDADEVVVADSTSVNLFKLLVAALRLRPNRRVILIESSNFPTDIYVARGVERLFPDVEIKLIPDVRSCDSLDEEVAVALVTHVDFKSARLHDIADVTRRAHEAGALVLWDLSHSTGAMELDLHACNVDLAVGCGYKYLNGGPGAPAFLFVARRLQQQVDQPITAWMGHDRPFEFSVDYAPASGITRMLSGTPMILSMAALEASLDLWSQIDLSVVRAKSVALSELFVRIVEQRLGDASVRLASPRDAMCRGSHIAWQHPQGYAVP
jgi:kynureninase